MGSCHHQQQHSLATSRRRMVQVSCLQLHQDEGSFRETNHYWPTILVGSRSKGAWRAEKDRVAAGEPAPLCSWAARHHQCYLTSVRSPYYFKTNNDQCVWSAAAPEADTHSAGTFSHLDAPKNHHHHHVFVVSSSLVLVAESRTNASRQFTSLWHLISVPACSDRLQAPYNHP